MRIAVDIMGGDKAPEAPLEGARLALERNRQLNLDLVGNAGAVREVLESWDQGLRQRVQVVETSQVVAMTDAPAQALRRKRDSSLVVAAARAGQNLCGGFVSAGNTGATMAAALHHQGRISGVTRPAIASPLPTVNGVSLLLDAGANADARPQFIPQFAVMGSVYAEMVMGVAQPRVGLLNIGEEGEKGNEFSREAYRLLQDTPVHFVGNVEGRQVPYGDVDVVVCDGFVGNVVLKLAEGLSMALLQRLRQELRSDWKSRLGAWLALPAFRRVRRALDYRSYGGAPLLGVRGLCIIAHGTSDGEAMANAIKVAATGARGGLAEEISRQIEPVMEE